MLAEVVCFKEAVVGPFDYYVFVEGQFKVINSLDLLRHLNELEAVFGRVRSARMTGIFGSHLCPSGNGRDHENFRIKKKKVPKNKDEVILAFGDEGLLQFVKWGFLPCPACHPEETPGFWESVAGLVKEVYGFDDAHDFLDRTKLPFDARRIAWEMLPVGLPSRLYLPKGLTWEDMAAVRQRFVGRGKDLPKMGYYDRGAAGGFVEYPG